MLQSISRYSETQRCTPFRLPAKGEEMFDEPDLWRKLAIDTGWPGWCTWRGRWSARSASS